MSLVITHSSYFQKPGNRQRFSDIYYRFYQTIKKLCGSVLKHATIASFVILPDILTTDYNNLW